jgi:hypothetical protein
MIPQKRHAAPHPGPAYAGWLRLPGLAWWQRWTATSGADSVLDTGADTAPLTPSPAAPVDIDLTLLESLPSIHWVTEAFGDAPRKDFSDTWRTRPNVRFVDPAPR